MSELFSDPISVIVPLDTSAATNSAQPTELPLLPANPTTEQLQAALKKMPPTCAGITASFVCGQHDAVPTYNGESIAIAAGDQLN